MPHLSKSFIYTYITDNEGAFTNVYEKMLKFLSSYYLELDKIPPTENPVSDDDDGNDI